MQKFTQKLGQSAQKYNYKSLFQPKLARNYTKEELMSSCKLQKIQISHNPSSFKNKIIPPTIEFHGSTERCLCQPCQGKQPKYIVQGLD